MNSNLYYRVDGVGDPLILIPGFASGAWNWNWQIDELSKEFQVITFDPRGIGKSTADNLIELENLSMRVFAEDVLQILDDLKSKKQIFSARVSAVLLLKNLPWSFPSD